MSYYGAGYQDVEHRRPSIRNARRLLKWTPMVGLEEAVEKTLDFFLQQAAEALDSAAGLECLPQSGRPLPFPGRKTASEA